MLSFEYEMNGDFGEDPLSSEMTRDLKMSDGFQYNTFLVMVGQRRPKKNCGQHTSEVCNV